MVAKLDQAKTLTVVKINLFRPLFSFTVSRTYDLKH